MNPFVRNQEVSKPLSLSLSESISPAIFLQTINAYIYVILPFYSGKKKESTVSIFCQFGLDQLE